MLKWREMRFSVAMTVEDPNRSANGHRAMLELAEDY